MFRKNALYPYGAFARLTALPQPGNAFALWGNAGGGTNNPLILQVTNSHPTVSAAFAPLSAGQSSLTSLADGFADVHAIMAELRAGQEARAEQRLAAMRETAASNDEAASTYGEVGVPLAEGLTAFHRGDYAGTVEHLLPARFELWRIGGSHAQRDVFDWTLAEAAGRGGLRDVALSLAHERLALKPRSHINRRFLQQAG